MKFNTWLTKKPDFTEECTCICAYKIRGKWEYSVFIIEWQESEGGGYMGWLTGDGDEYGDLSEMEAHQYYLMPKKN